jgi:hypothetical protein
MADEILSLDENGRNVMGGVTNDASLDIVQFRVDPSTKRLLVDATVSVTNNAEHAEDAAFSNGATGLLVLGVRQDADTSPVSADGDYHTPIFDNAGALKVNVKSIPSHAVTNAGTFAVQVDGAALTSLQLIDNSITAEDTASANTDGLTAVGVVRKDTPVANALVSADGDYTNILVDNLGKLWTADNQVEDAAHVSGDRGSFVLAVANEANTARAADGDYLAFATDTEGNVRIVGNRDHDAVDAGEVVSIGGFATTTNQTRVSSGDRTHFIADLAGRQVANLGQVRELRSKQTTTISASTSETTVITAGAAGVFNDIVALIISNTSGTAARVDIRDATSGTILFSLYIPAGDIRGFTLPGFSIPQTTAANNWTAQSSASVTDLRVLAIFEKNT